MTDERDTKIAEALGALPVPEHGPAFWANVEAALDASPRPPRVRVLHLAAAFVAVVLAAAAVVFLRGGDSGREVVTQPDETTVPAGGPPETFVGVEAGRIATFSTETGQRLQWLTAARSNGTDAEPRDVGGNVWFVRRVEHGCQDSIWRFDATSGIAAEVVAARGLSIGNLAASADGSMLAWRSVHCVAMQPGSSSRTDGIGGELRVRNVATGAERGVTEPSPPLVYGPLAWAPDNRHLALMARGGGGAAYGINVINASTAMSIEDAEYGLQGDYCYQEFPQYLDDGSLVLLTCARPERIGTVAAVKFDSAGSRIGPILQMRGPFVANGVDQVRSFSLTRDGKHAIYQTADDRGRRRTYVWDDGKTRRVGTDARDLAW